MMKVGVIMGGISSEREVSLKSGRGILNNIDKTKYEVIEVILDSKEDIFTRAKGLDFALLALHGKFGEDGTIQAILDSMSIPYSGCDTLTSALCMDKNMTKKILKAEDIPTAPWTTVKSLEEINYDKIEKIGYPVFIKPNSGGSSVATFLIENKEEVYEAVRQGLLYDKEVMIEKYIKGEEYTSFVLNGYVFPTVSIKTDNKFFDYEAKYSTDGKGAKEEVVYLDADLQKKLNVISSKCWEAFNCRVYVRIDVIIVDDIPYVLELNTLPGMTPTSLIPQSARANGLEYSELIDKIIEYSLV